MSDAERAKALRAALDRLGLVGRKLEGHADNPPGVYEAVTRQMLEDAIEGQRELRRLLYGVLGALIVALVTLGLRS